MSRFQTSWEIAKRSWAVLRADKTLAWFPVLSALGSLVVFGIIGGLFLAPRVGDSSTGTTRQPAGRALIVPMYLARAMAQTYFLPRPVARAALRLGRPGTPP